MKMRITSVTGVTGFLLLCLMVACSDILVEDISEEQIFIIAPADSAVTYDTKQTLLWESLDGATEYELLIFTPDLAGATSVVLDTVVRGTSYVTALPAAHYEWCVTASNGAYVSLTSCHKLVVKENMEGKEVELLAPADGLGTLTKKQTFWWAEIAGATEYRLMIVTPDLLEVEEIVIDTVLTKNSIRIELAPGQYEWCVTAGDGVRQTEAVCRKLEITEEEE